MNHILECAKNSVNHRHEKKFLAWLEKAKKLMPEILNLSCGEIRDRIILKKSSLSQNTFDKLNNLLDDEFGEIGEIVASKEYDYIETGSSGFNAVYELCSVYKLLGSDFNIGPSDTYFDLIEQLQLDELDTGVKTYISHHIQ